MNIELLEEINKELKNGTNIQDIANELALQKSAILLMLRMQKILNNNDNSLIIKDLELELSKVKKENLSLSSKIEKLNRDLNNNDLQSNIKFSNDYVEELKNDNLRLDYQLSRIPLFIQNIFLR